MSKTKTDKTAPDGAGKVRQIVRQAWVDHPSRGGWWWDNLWNVPRFVWEAHTGKLCAVCIHGQDCQELREPSGDYMKLRWFGPLKLPPNNQLTKRRDRT